MADFDEYEYLEKTVEEGIIAKDSNGDAARDEHKSSKRRSEDDHDHRSKKSREGEDERDRRHGSHPRSGRERDRDVEERHSRERSKGREKERERDRERPRERERDRDADKERDRHREKERERDRKRAPSREKSSRAKSREVEEPVEPEADPERDQRTVFAYQINLKADERDVYEFFSRAGKVRDVRLIMDRNSRRSKGVGYVEFYDAMSVPMAIAMSGQVIRGTPVMVKPSEAEKNLVQSTAGAAAVAATTMGLMGGFATGVRRLYVGNLHYNMTDEAVRQVFEPFGTVELVQMPRDPETGNCKGYAFVQYAKLEDARAAEQNLNGLDLAGKQIKVAPVSESTGGQEVVEKGELDDDEGGGLSLNARSRALLMQKLDRSGGPAGSMSPAPAVAPIPGVLPNIPGLTAAVPALSSAAAVGNPLASLVRPPLLGMPGVVLPGMAGLPGFTTAPVVESIGFPSEFLMLKNMFDPTTETEPDFDLDIKDDVREECSKFGAVKHIYVDKHSAGHVFLHFDSVAAASNAQRALHGRFFAGKTISALFLTASAYKSKFPDS